MEKMIRFYNIKTNEQLSSLAFEKAVEKGEIDVEDWEEFTYRYSGSMDTHKRKLNIGEAEYNTIKKYLTDHTQYEASKEFGRSKLTIKYINNSDDWEDYTTHRSDTNYFADYRVWERKGI